MEKGAKRIKGKYTEEGLLRKQKKHIYILICEKKGKEKWIMNFS